MRGDREVKAKREPSQGCPCRELPGYRSRHCRWSPRSLPLTSYLPAPLSLWQPARQAPPEGQRGRALRLHRGTGRRRRGSFSALKVNLDESRQNQMEIFSKLVLYTDHNTSCYTKNATVPTKEFLGFSVTQTISFKKKKKRN